MLGAYMQEASFSTTISIVILQWLPVLKQCSKAYAAVVQIPTLYPLTQPQNHINQKY